MSGPAIANAACGIQSNSRVIEMEWLEQMDSRFGPVDRIRIVDPADDRLYAVNAQGVLVASEQFPRTASGRYCVQTRVIAVDNHLPEEDIFSAASLSRSVVPSRFRSRGEEDQGDLWLSHRRCI
jgi:hypothetical protein